MSDSPGSSRTSRPRWLRAPSPWLIVPAAVLAGLLLFLAVWLSQRPAPEDDGAAVLPAVSVGPDAQDAPLPAPRPPDLAQDTAGEDADTGVFVLPDAPAEPPRTAGEPPAAGETAPDATLPPAVADVPDRQPVPIHSPRPAYPSRALRRGASGEVLVRVLVGADGRPRQVEVARSSSHRALDQAALKAVRSWRFQPATRDGQPVAQAVHVPFDFSP